MKKKNQNNEAPLKWWQLAIIGVGSIIGTGYFLGSSIAIKMTGPSVMISYLLAAISTYLVFDSLSRMTAKDPQKGSFRTYAKQAFGRWTAFCSGWVYWVSEMLIVGSQMTALALFSKYWFPSMPLWLFATIYGILGILVILFGTKSFDHLENIFAVVKVAAILMFIIIAFLSFTGILGKGNDHNFPNTLVEFFPHQFKGLWSSFIFAFYAFGGIEVMGMMSTRLEKKEDAPKSGKVMLLLLAIIYILSIGLAITMDPWHAFKSDESPFVTSLDDHHLPFFPHVFNGALIIAGFSTMVASLYGVTTMIVVLAKEGDAPKFLLKKKETEHHKTRPPLIALLFTIFGMFVSIIFSLLMPAKIYEYITTAAGLMLIYNWLLILIVSGRLIKNNSLFLIKRYAAIIIILFAISGTLLQTNSRSGFYISLFFLAIILIIGWKMKRKWSIDNKNIN